MAARSRDPYETLGVSRRAGDDELRAAYRRLVQLHHPDHNAGSVESARRFEEVQEAYAQIRRLRGSAARPGQAPPRARTTQTPPRSQAPPRTSSRRAADSRLANMEREIREAHLARERARQAAREAAAENVRRPSDEELGYVTTDDSFSSILADARRQAAEALAGAREPVTKRVADLLDELASKLNGDASPGSRD